MSFQISPAFAQAELEYRQQRIKSDFRQGTGRPVRRIRLASLFKPHRRPNPAPRHPMAAPHHLTSGS